MRNPPAWGSAENPRLPGQDRDKKAPVLVSGGASSLKGRSMLKALTLAFLASILATTAFAQAGDLHAGERGTVVDIGSHLAYLKGGTPCANTLADEQTLEDPSFSDAPDAVKAISIVLAPGTRVVIVGIGHFSDSIPIRLRVLSGEHTGSTCWVQSDGDRVYPVRFDFEKGK
jgi:hypothetical protein